ncbi:MAG: methylenetetrahydrofolate--tRNA-(uracil(54)-C(5))-methyltransferase (FADH(2)-oxidizing) TrmFO [Chitinivibrionales bacterium]|nr:methylenetetrahydrofolate--tRNA-(uracil(54)-C(5))-methyltransferase (FADH(2)-oxidizing) TrmFO [Chitinivibrionales bacterium]
MDRSASVGIVGAGLAGSEAALVCASRGIPVTLYEMRPLRMTPAHAGDLPAELVCSNSLKSDCMPSAHALLKKELELLRSPLLECAYSTRLKAGSALAVDRQAFSNAVLARLTGNPAVSIVRREIIEIGPEHPFWVLAAGPLISEALSAWIAGTVGAAALHFYDAIAPIVRADSLDSNKVFFASRWQEGTGDYGNCPFTEEEYGRFYAALVAADALTPRPFEEARFFEGCLPVEVIAGRGRDALRFGPLRPVGLIDPATGKRPFAVGQLRRENSNGDCYNMVGFQTRLRMSEQKRVFRMIPGMERAEFERFGSIHRNTYLNAPDVLSPDLSLRGRSNIFVAGQLCGNEGYTESIATGHFAALMLAARINGIPFSDIPQTCALGAMINKITLSRDDYFAPVGMNLSLFPPLDEDKKKIAKSQKKEAICTRALQDLSGWISHNNITSKPYQ